MDFQKQTYKSAMMELATKENIRYRKRETKYQLQHFQKMSATCKSIIHTRIHYTINKYKYKQTKHQDIHKSLGALKNKLNDQIPKHIHKKTQNIKIH
jgi:hypothetical protein